MKKILFGTSILLACSSSYGATFWSNTNQQNLYDNQGNYIGTIGGSHSMQINPSLWDELFTSNILDNLDSNALSVESITQFAGNKHSLSNQYHDSIYRVDVGYGECVIAFEDSGFEGEVRFYQQGSHSLGSFTNKISSVHVISNTSVCNSSLLTTFYRHWNMGYPQFSLLANTTISDLSSFQAHRYWNDEITSIKVGKNFSNQNQCVTLSEHWNYTGRTFDINKDISNLSNVGFNDKVSSLKVSSQYCADATNGETSDDGSVDGPGWGHVH